MGYVAQWREHRSTISARSSLQVSPSSIIKKYLLLVIESSVWAQAGPHLSQKASILRRSSPLAKHPAEPSLQRWTDRAENCHTKSLIIAVVHIRNSPQLPALRLDDPAVESGLVHVNNGHSLFDQVAQHKGHLTALCTQPGLIDEICSIDVLA